MTAKEKAKELVYKYRYLVTIWDCYNDCDIKIKDRLPDMKQCALIAIDEMIEQQKEQSDNMHWSCVNYWEEVKQEIEKL
jgi:hypothetical protein